MSADGEVVGTAEFELLARMQGGELISVGVCAFDVLGPSASGAALTVHVGRSEQPVAAAQTGSGAPVDSDSARPSGDVVAAVVATLRYVTSWAADINGIEHVEARDLISAADNTEAVGADRDVCPVCEEVACDDDCPLAPYRTPHYRAS